MAQPFKAKHFPLKGRVLLLHPSFLQYYVEKWGITHHPSALHNRMTPLALVRKRRKEPTFQSSGNGQKGQTYLRKNTSLYQYMTSKDSCFLKHFLKGFGLKVLFEALNSEHMASVFGFSVLVR